jgi:hypothetical protein
VRDINAQVQFLLKNNRLDDVGGQIGRWGQAWVAGWAWVKRRHEYDDDMVTRGAPG